MPPPASYFARISAVLRRPAIATAFAISIFTGFALPAISNEHLQARDGDRVLGAINAPIVMIEYYSLDCPHCTSFHLDAFPKLKSEFIDTGKVRFVFRDFPLSWAAQESAILTHCASPERYFAVQDALFKSLGEWSKAESTLQAVTNIGEAQGVSPDAYQACIDARVWERQVFEGQKFAREVLGVKVTPTFLINNDKLEGNIPFDKLAQGLTNMLDEIEQQGLNMTNLAD